MSTSDSWERWGGGREGRCVDGRRGGDVGTEKDVAGTSRGVGGGMVEIMGVVEWWWFVGVGISACLSE